MPYVGATVRSPVGRTTVKAGDLTIAPESSDQVRATGICDSKAMSRVSDTHLKRVRPPEGAPAWDDGDARSTRRFMLSKWYLDCVGEGGEAFIGYWAELRWRRIATRYTSAILFAGGRLEERSSLRAGPAPEKAGGLIKWSCKSLKTDGDWNASSPAPFNRALYRRGAGGLEWHCLQPLADANVRFGERQIRGHGYAERITLTIPPWDLPIEDLRWGRAHFPGRSLVWINWTGKEPVGLLLVDGNEVEGLEVTDTLVSTIQTTVRLHDRRTIRQGPIGGTSIGAIPGVRQALSKAGLLIDEHKWLSSATLEENGAILHGNAVHEVVKWR